MHNPETNSGGVLLGTVLEVGQCRETLPTTENCPRTLLSCFAPLREREREGWVGAKPSATSRCGSLLPPASADVRASDDVIAF